jgi:hypothetical protein
MTKYNMSARDFVASWLRASSLDDVSCDTGLEKNEVNAFAATLRKIGVKLPSMKRGRKASVIDVAAVAELNAMIVPTV